MRSMQEFVNSIHKIDMIRSLSKMYYASYIFDIPDNTFLELHSEVLKVHMTIGEQGNLRETILLMSEKLVRDEYKELIAEFTDIETLNERMKYKDFITCEYEGIVSGWSEAIFLVFDRLPNGDVHHVLFLIRTVSEKKRKEYEAVKRLKDDLEFERLGASNIQEILGSAFWSLRMDEHGKIIDFSFDEAYRRMIGVGYDSTLTIDAIYEYIHDDDKNRVYNALMKAISDTTGTVIYDQEYRVKMSDDTYKWFRCAGKLSRREEMSGAVFFGILVDINDKVLAQQAFAREKKITHKQLEILFSAAKIYLTMHLIDFSLDELIDFSAINKEQESGNRKKAKKVLTDYILSVVTPEYKEKALEFVDFGHVREELRNKIIISQEVICNTYGWVRASFIIVNRDENGIPRQALFTTQVIEEEKRREEELLIRSNTDKLTRILNRAAYEEDLSYYSTHLPKDDYVFVSFDINGLKEINDTYGHAAGDEIIVGAAACMKDTIGCYGKLYRVGGDEFAAMIHVDYEKLPFVFNIFEHAYQNWVGHYVNSISVSYGYASRKEYANASVEELAQIADERMYIRKANYYHEKGVDRRGQADAFKIICDSYVRISKVDLSRDRYQDMRALSDDKELRNVFSENIKEMIDGNMVAQEDVCYLLKHTNLQSLREYFKGGNKSFRIRYKRLVNGEYRLVLMEVIPTQEYTDDNQLVFVYVKDIDLA